MHRCFAFNYGVVDAHECLLVIPRWLVPTSGHVHTLPLRLMLVQIFCCVYGRDAYFNLHATNTNLSSFPLPPPRNSNVYT